MFSHNFSLLICRRNANTTERNCMQISRYIVNGQKVRIRLWWESVLSSASMEPSHHFLQTFRPLRIFEIVFRNSSLYRKQISLFCLLRLISECPDRLGYITNFCSMMHELKTAVVNTEAFRHLIMSQQGKRKTNSLLDSYTQQKNGSFLAYFILILKSCKRFPSIKPGNK